MKMGPNVRKGHKISLHVKRDQELWVERTEKEKEKEKEKKKKRKRKEKKRKEKERGFHGPRCFKIQILSEWHCSVVTAS